MLASVSFLWAVANWGAWVLISSAIKMPRRTSQVYLTSESFAVWNRIESARANEDCARAASYSTQRQLEMMMAWQEG